jgi:uncharacterized protein (TIGR02186 family)
MTQGMVSIRVLVLFMVPLLVLLVRPAQAIDSPLQADVSTHLVAITTGFNGTDILVFGAAPKGGDVVIVVRGPHMDATVRKKGALGPIYANVQSVTFQTPPSFYQVVSTRPLSEISLDPMLGEREIGLENLRLTTVEDLSDADYAAFRQALLDLKRKSGLYGQRSSGISTIEGKLFRTNVQLPANVPVGVYTVEVYLFKNGETLDAEIQPLNVSKVGLEADIYDFAHEQSLLYGIVAVIIAVFAGWFASVIFRKS